MDKRRPGHAFGLFVTKFTVRPKYNNRSGILSVLSIFRLGLRRLLDVATIWWEI